MDKMRVFVLCTEEGEQLRPLTARQPKCLIPYRGKPLLQYQLEHFQDLRLLDVVLVGGYRHDALPSGYRKVINPRHAETNLLYGLFLAADLMNSNQSALVAYGNIIYDATVLQTLLSSRDPLAVVTDIAWEQYWKARMDDPLQDVESFRWDPATRKIFELGGKPGTLEEIQGQFIGLFKIDRDYVKTFKQMYLLFCQEHSDAGKARITDFLNYLIEKQQPIFGVPVYNQWAEFNIPRDLEFNADF